MNIEVKVNGLWWFFGATAVVSAGAKNKHKAEVFMQESAMEFNSYIAELASLAADCYRITGEGFRGTPRFLLYNPKGKLLGMQTGPFRIEALENFMAKNSS